MMATSTYRHGDPHLRLDRVLRGAEEALDAQRLLDPSKKQFHLPPTLVEGADGERRQGEVVGEEDQRLGGIGILEANAAQALGVALMRVEHGQLHRLIADQPGAAIHGPRGQASEFGIGLRSRDEEAAGLMQCIEALEVQVSAIHHVEGTRLGHKQVEDVDIVELAIADMDEGGNGAAQIEQRVQFHRRLGLTKRGPGKQRQTKGRSWSSPARRPSRSVRHRAAPWRTGAGQCESTLGRTRNRYASRVLRWRRQGHCD